MSTRWSDGLLQSWKPFIADLDGQQLSQILPHVENDVRRHIARHLDCIDQAKCLMVTSSGWKQAGTVQMLEELEATYKCRQQFRQLAQAQATEDTCVANVTQAAGSLTPQMSKRDRQSVLDAVEERLLSLQVYQQALMQAVKTFQSDHLLMRLTQQHASIAEWLVQLEHQTQCCKIVKIQGQELFQTFHAMHP